MDENIFDDIRPYFDREVADVLERLYHDDQFIQAIARQRFGRWEPVFSFMSHPFIRRSLKPQIKKLQDVETIQNKVGRYLRRMIRNRTSGFTVSGLESLDRSKNYLFIGNHRDIALDAALTNYALHLDNRGTCRIAIGDNLLSKPYVSDLMRLNKSFIVNRSASAPREMLANFKKLSAYIRHSIIEDRSHIWIAQAEGRAKDGMDRTQNAIIKMIAMARDKGQDFESYIHDLNIVPIAVSYELDPNDARKAKELYVVDKYGSYRKDKHEDVDSITRGIQGEKGHIHLSFGQPLYGSYKGPKDVTKAIDDQVINIYQLHLTNYWAFEMLHGAFPEEGVALQAKHIDKKFAKKRDQFKERMNAIPEKHRTFALQMYANAYIQQKTNKQASEITASAH